MLAAGAAALTMGASSPAFAAYGDSANVFGKVTNKSGELSICWACGGGSKAGVKGTAQMDLGERRCRCCCACCCACLLRLATVQRWPPPKRHRARVRHHYAAPPQPPPQNATGFVPYAGEGFAILLPSRWNPSKEDDYGKFAKTQLR